MYKKILAAAERLSGVAHKTPVLTSRLLNESMNSQIYLKAENFQRMGAFKFRGAYNAISALSSEEKAKGVITFSSGNHAQAIALSGKLLGVKATVVVPSDAPAVKLDAAKGYGAEIVLYDRATESREAIAQALTDRYGYSFIPPFDHEEVIAGQGTATKELIEEIGKLDYLFVQVGGGGLISGSAIAAKQLSPGCKVIGVEPQLADDATRSFKTGMLHRVENSATVADGLRSTSLGKITFPIIQQYVDDMVTVTESDILGAMHYLWTRFKAVVEPSGAVGFAAIMYSGLPLGGKKAGAILSGGNVDVRQTAKFFAEM